LRETAIEVAETKTKEHGRHVHRRLQTTTRLSGYLDWPGVEQVCRLTRATRRNGQEEHEVEYAITSVPRSKADAGQILAWWRGHWGIENRVHYVRDVTFGEDASRIRTASAPQVLAAMRNAVLSLLRLSGCTNIAAALRHNVYQPGSLLAKLGVIK
jgi:predicted transposase YbfD/YdcC